MPGAARRALVRPIWVRSMPFKRSILPLIDEAYRQHAEKQHHRPEAVEAKVTERRRPRKQKADLEIENDEEDRDQIKTHVEFNPGAIEGIKAALVGGQLFRIGLLVGDDEGHDQKQKPDHPRDTDKYNERQ